MLYWGFTFIRQFIFNYSFQCFLLQSIKTGQAGFVYNLGPKNYKITCIALEAYSVAGTARKWWKFKKLGVAERSLDIGVRASKKLWDPLLSLLLPRQEVQVSSTRRMLQCANSLVPEAKEQSKHL